jgi:general stress protein 26
MSQIEVPYDEMKQKVVDYIEKHPYLYLATSEDKNVTVRRMGFINDGLKIWMVTDEESRKYKQITSNPKVAIASGGDLQLEGIAELKGHPIEKKNLKYIEVYKNKRPEMYERLSRPGRNLKRPGTRLIEVNPKRIALNFFSIEWDKEKDKRPYTLLIDTKNEKAYKLYGTNENITDLYKTAAYKK